MATVEHEEWRIGTSPEDFDQAVLRYTDLSDKERAPVEIDFLCRDELKALHEALGAYLSLPNGLP